jgi:Protein of unknown function (DUF4058)
MPLRDHFHPPVENIASWEELHGAWPATIAYRMNAILPPQFRCGLKVHLGTLVEVDVATYEVRVYDLRRASRLVAAVEIVSPSNKDRPQSRMAFVDKCHAMLQQEVCVVIVDPVTNLSANLYAELAARLGAKPPAIAASSIYAVSCRTRPGRRGVRVETWEHELHVGSPIPTLPLWLTETLAVDLELEATYEDTCRGLRIP